MAPKGDNRKPAMPPQQRQRLRSGLPAYSPRHLSPETCRRLFPPVTVTNDNGKRPFINVSEDTSPSSEHELAPRARPRPTKRSKAQQEGHRVETRSEGVLEGPENSGNGMSSPPAPSPIETSTNDQDNDPGQSGPRPKGRFGLYFSKIEEVNSKNAVIFTPPADNTLPKSSEERQAIVKRLVDAITYVDPSLKDPKAKAPPKSFESRWLKRTYYQPVQIEKAAWEILNELDRLYTQGWTRPIYDDGLMASIAATKDWKFTERVDEIVALLRVAKNMCESLLKGEKLWSIIGIPRTLRSSSETNKKQNARRQVRLDLGKKAEPKENGRAKDISTIGPTVATSVIAESTSQPSPDSTIPAMTRAQSPSDAQPPQQPDEASEQIQCTVQHTPVQSSQPGPINNRDPSPDCTHQGRTTATIPNNQEPEVSDAIIVGDSTRAEEHQTENETLLDEGGCSAPETCNMEDNLNDKEMRQVDEPNMDDEIQDIMNSDEHTGATSEAANESTSPNEMHTSSADNEDDDPSPRPASTVLSYAEDEQLLSQSFLAELDDLLSQEISRMHEERSPQPPRFKAADGVVYQAAQNPGTQTHITDYQLPTDFTPITPCGSKRRRSDDDGDDSNLDSAQQGPQRKKSRCTKDPRVLHPHSGRTE